MRRIVLITGVSASGKTSLQEELLKRGWNRPLNYTTRKPRDKNALLSVDKDGDFNSPELDEYIFLSELNFFKKMKNGDLLENTNYMGNRYGVSSILPKGNICIVVDPVGRSQIMEYFVRRGINVETYYLEISKEQQIERLTKRGDTEKDIIRRRRDFLWFSPTTKCKKLNGMQDSSKLADIIINNI